MLFRSGDHHAARVSTSLLRAAGLAELVAVDPAGFTRIAASLAGDRSRLAALRRDLRLSLQRSPLLDAASYAARLHAGLRSCFDDWCSSRA